MTGKLVADTDRVCRWFDREIGTEVGSPVHEAIGYELHGLLVAAVCFDGLLSNSVQAHIVSRAPVVPYELLVAAARYAFVQCDVERMTFITPETNVRAIALALEMGAEPEGRLRRAFKDGDALVYVLWKSAPFVQKCLAHASAGAAT